MKIMILAPYIYDKNFPEFCVNKTGFGIMCNDIFTSISEKLDTYIITHVITSGHGKYILKHTILDVLMNAKLKDWLQGIIWFFKFRQSLKGRIQYLFYCIDKGYVRKVISKIQPNVVHIHGLNQSTKTYIEICEELKIPYIVTLHGLIGLSETVNAPIWDKEYEKEFLIFSEKKDIPITVISSGIKKRIEIEYLKHNAENINIITNGVKNSYDKIFIGKKLDIKMEYTIPNEWKIGLCIGSICKRKNQVQIIEALAKLKKRGKLNCVIFFCGMDTTNGIIKKKIENYNLQKNAILLGFINRSCISDMMEQADFNIVASKDEGYGLSIIEAYAHGIPTITFDDIDAIDDLYDEKAMFLSKERSTESLANSIYNATNKEWDSDYIKSISAKFSLQNMTENYVQEYYRVAKLKKI